MSMSESQKFNSKKKVLVKQIDLWKNELEKLQKLEIHMVDQLNDPHKEANEYKIRELRTKIGYFNELLDILHNAEEGKKNQTFVGHLFQLYKKSRNKTVTERSRIDEPNFHELKKISIVIPDYATKLKAGHKANIFPKRKFGGRRFWENCSQEYLILSHNRALLNYQSSIPMVQLCASLLRDRLRACKIGRNVHNIIKRGEKVKMYLRKSHGDYVLRTYRLMAFVVRSEEFLNARSLVENQVDIILQIAKRDVINRTYPMEEFFKERHYWISTEMILDMFEEFADKVKVHVPFSFCFPLSNEMNGKTLRYELKTYYDKTACEIPKTLYLKRKELQKRKIEKKAFAKSYFIHAAQEMQDETNESEKNEKKHQKKGKHLHTKKNKKPVAETTEEPEKPKEHELILEKDVISF